MATEQRRHFNTNSRDVKRRIAARANSRGRPRAPAPTPDSGVLIRALRGVPVKPEDVNPGSLLTQAAVHHGVVVPLYRACRLGGAENGVESLAAVASNRRASALRISHWSIVASNWLTEAAVPHAIVKGPAVATAYPDADREFMDLDILVAPASMYEAIDVMKRQGASALEDASWPRDDGYLQLAFGLPSGVTVELHADLAHTDDVRRDFDFQPEVLLSRTTTVAVLGHELPALDPEDTIIHVAFHAMLSGGDRLVWLADLDALVRHTELGWTVLIERARGAKLALVLGVMLQRAAVVLDTPVPPDAMQELLRRGMLWSRLLVDFERRRPTAANFDRKLRGQVLIRSTRDSTATSLRKLARLLWTDVILFVVTDRRHPWRRR